METFRRKRWSDRASSPLKVTTIVDRNYGENVGSSERAQRGCEHTEKQRSFHKRLGSESGSCSSGLAVLEDLGKLHIEQRFSEDLTGVAMKKLLAKEMSKDSEVKRRSPSVIARLMGLDGLPPQQRRTSESYQQRTSRTASHKSSRSYDNLSSRKSSKEQQMFKDVYEVPRSSNVESRSYPCHGSLNRKKHEDEVAFVREKFMDAKRLSTDRRLQTSKEFIDALEVLDSNKDLLLKFFDEPDSLFEKHLHDLHCSDEFHHGHSRGVKSSALKHNINAIGCQSGREASRKIDISFSHKHQDGLQYPSPHGQVCDAYTSSHVAAEVSKDESAIKIVVLKPNLMKIQNIGQCESCSPSDPFSDFEAHKEKPSIRLAEAELCGKKRLPDNFEISGVKSRESRELAKEITRRMKNKLGTESFNTSLSAFRGYFADESSHDCSEFESSYESDATTSISWTLLSRSSRGRSSSSRSESSMNREAKKRLSERWKMTHKSQEEVVVDKGSTLAEMLAIPDIASRVSNIESKIGHNGFGGFDRKDPMVGWIAPLGISSRDGWKDGSFGALSRSKSLPSSNYSGSPKTGVRHEVRSAERFLIVKECSCRGGSKAIRREGRRHGESCSPSVRTSNRKSASPCHVNSSSIEVQDVQFGKSGRNSSLDEKRSLEEKDVILETSIGSLDASLNLGTSVDVEQEEVNESLASYEDLISGPESSSDLLLGDETCIGALHDSMPKKPSRILNEDGKACSKLTATQPQSCVSTKEADQPSPVSVLEASLVEEVSSGSECFERVSAELHGLRMQLQLLRQESEDYDGTSSISSNDDLGEVFSRALEERRPSEAEDTWEASYLATMLREVELDSANHEAFEATCHSPDCPVAPWVFEKLEKYSDDSVCSRSARKLLFDHINTGILEAFQQFSDPYPWVKHGVKTTRPRWCGDGFKAELQKALKRQEKNATESNLNLVLVSDSKWLNLAEHIDMMGRDIENMLIDKLVAELMTV